jgi:hypothetical protein
LTNIKYVWQQVEEDLHQWIKRSSEKLPDEVAKLLMKKARLTNLLLMKPAKLDEKADAEVVLEGK